MNTALISKAAEETAAKEAMFDSFNESLSNQLSIAMRACELQQEYIAAYHTVLREFCCAPQTTVELHLARLVNQERNR